MRAAVATGSGLVLAATLTASPSLADPDNNLTLAEAQRKVAKLSHEAEQANERYLELKTEVDGAKKQIKKLRADVKAQEGQVTEVRNALAKTITERLSTSPMGPTTQLLASGNPDEFLDGLAALQSYNSTQADRMAAFQGEADELKVRKQQLASKLAIISDSQEEMSKQQDKLDDRVAEAKALVEQLTPVERTQVYDGDDHGGTSRGDDRPNAPKVDASGRAKQAIDFALAQLGEPYVYGAAGPSSWDCSGLTMEAYAAAGVSLPHSSSAQSGMGTAVSTSSMSPGDLVFYYSPVSHVGIYLGDGKLVHAPRPGRSVEITSVNEMPITGVRRVG